MQIIVTNGWVWWYCIGAIYALPLRIMTASEEIKDILFRKRWNAKRLADEAGLPASTVTRIVNGETSPLHTTMVLLREAAKRKRKIAA